MGTFKRSRELPPAAVAAFAVMVANPGRWFDVPQLVAVTGFSRGAICPRFDDLVKLGALRATPAYGKKAYMLSDHWQFCEQAVKLHKAATPAQPS